MLLVKFAVLTSVETRHRYVANALRRALPVVAVGYERTGYSPAATASEADLTEGERRIVCEHYEDRARQEERYFGHDAAFIEHGSSAGPAGVAVVYAAGAIPAGSGAVKVSAAATVSAARAGTAAEIGPAGSDRAKEAEVSRGSGGADAGCSVRPIAPGKLNSADTLQFLQEAGAGALLVYGTNLIKPPLLDAFAGRIINLHLGLSPYYRGTATNFYPLLNDEPEYVGATVHLIDAGIDSGPILHHARPVIAAEDGPHMIGCKAILAGVEKMILAARELSEGRLAPVPQWAVPNPRLYLRRDFHPRQVVRLHEMLADGLIPRYVARAAEVAPRVRLVE
ncbi:MAG: formyl transferase [Phycisphaerae bacterium]|nr:MAG: hypothetical protein EDS66_12695 [Planctomycetota bacterium]KAB2940020.1 MAG: hypothetical protein F9K17_14360 [Phycisphaerae bacterium]MBE7455266.1 hypothetical protein [Planctomycetia bacterium]MCK6464079.1 formyl transferase [Phycisphaerae bacterium]MCL4717748.1 formyl transferase [Phycisphaerae bacterium]